MNKEIKEIFKRMNDLIEHQFDKEYHTKCDLFTDIQDLLDCITNLQSEVKSGNNIILAHKNRIKELKKEITNLQEENEKLHKELDYADNYNIYLISRIDKAIKYITSEESINIFTSINAREKWLKINHRLLNILQGSDKDE